VSLHKGSATHSEHTELILPTDEGVQLHWFTNIAYHGTFPYLATKQAAAATFMRLGIDLHSFAILSGLAMKTLIKQGTFVGLKLFVTTVAAPNII
jgi:hypothetical protein